MHHSGFVKPEAEHLGTHLLSRLPCSRNESGPWRDWRMSDTHRLRADAFADGNLVPVLEQGAAARLQYTAANVADALFAVLDETAGRA